MTDRDPTVRHFLIGFGLFLILAAGVLWLVRDRMIGVTSPPPTPAEPKLVAVEPPPFVGMEPGVQQQFAEARRQCDAIVTNPQSSATDRGTAWGELGKVHLAYGFLESAAGCFHNAVALDPTDFRWSFYL
ncbi:MAG: hypothetical protein JSS02_20180, partial [Planctomycetes bacterium]|nr:hypothetical protein [Planctomycetota bacterium]